MEEDNDEGDWAAAPEPISSRPVVERHIKKRALRNKALSVGFNDKDLKDFVTGFHKRKKKRRKEAQRQLQEKDRLRRIEARRKRKLEKERALYGGELPKEDSIIDGPSLAEDAEELEADEPDGTKSIFGTKLYDNGDMTITITTSELSREVEDPRPVHFIPRPSIAAEKKSLLPKKKPLKKVANKKSRKKRQKHGLQKNGKKARNKR